MKRPTLIAVLIAQTVLLFLVAWAGVYFARDEFLLATGRHGDDDDEALSKAAATTEENGVPTVRLSAAAQRNVGLEVAMPEPAHRGAEVSVPAVVLDASPLVELQGRLRAARHEADAARAVAVASAAERQRLQGLFDDDRNASQRALDAAIAQAASDAARERGAQSALAALREGARATWGAALARELEADGGNGLVARLSSGREVLLRASLRSDEAAAAGARLLINLPGRNQAVVANALGAAGPGAGDGSGGRSLLFRAAGSGLVAGQRVAGQLSEGREAMQAGVLVPTTAVIWHAGQPWIYIRESNEPQDVSPADPGAEPAEPAASATPSKPAPVKAARDDDDDDKPRGGAKPKAAEPPTAASEPASAASAPAEATPANDRFQRRAVPHARRVGDRWFLPGYVEDDPVVVRGAQLLLSEELKFQIRNENDD